MPSAVQWISYRAVVSAAPGAAGSSREMVEIVAGLSTSSRLLVLCVAQRYGLSVTSGLRPKPERAGQRGTGMGQSLH